MLNIRLVTDIAGSDVLAVPVRPAGPGADSGPRADGGGVEAELVPPAGEPPAGTLTDAVALLPLFRHTGAAGTAHLAVRSSGPPSRLLLVGIGAGDPAGWRAMGAAVARSAAKETSVTVALPAEVDPESVRALAEGVWLASYRFRMPDQEAGPTLGEVRLAVADPEPFGAVLAAARVTTEATGLARDLANMPSSVKSPEWFADRVVTEAGRQPGLTVTVREPDRLAAEGFGGILAVGGGSARGPRLVELGWQPDGARTHVVLVGKGITFDTGGVSIKPVAGMKLMRKDMSGAAAVLAATIGAAALRLPVRVTALAPLAENAVSGSAYRPGDVVRHYGGLTSESSDTDAEGRLVLADALAYAVDRLAPDLLVDLATLTGANAVALGKRTAALYADNDELAGRLTEAADSAGERAWRMPLPVDYAEYLGSELADLYSAPDRGVGAGSVVAALYLREFVGGLRDRWAHLDMSAPSWADGDDGDLVKGATGWGVRMLLRWLTAVADRDRAVADRPLVNA